MVPAPIPTPLEGTLVTTTGAGSSSRVIWTSKFFCKSCAGSRRLEDPDSGWRPGVAGDRAAPIATEALTRIASLYRIESEIRGRSAEERCAVRRQRSRPILEALELWLREKLALVSQKSKLAEAIRYALNHWTGLTLFLEDGKIEIDSNVVERSIRPLALNRKNALFAGSDEGASYCSS